MCINNIICFLINTIVKNLPRILAKTRKINYLFLKMLLLKFEMLDICSSTRTFQSTPFQYLVGSPERYGHMPNTGGTKDNFVFTIGCNLMDI